MVSILANYPPYYMQCLILCPKPFIYGDGPFIIKQNAHFVIHTSSCFKLLHALAGCYTLDQQQYTFRHNQVLSTIWFQCLISLLIDHLSKCKPICQISKWTIPLGNNSVRSSDHFLPSRHCTVIHNTQCPSVTLLELTYPLDSISRLPVTGSRVAINCQLNFTN